MFIILTSSNSLFKPFTLILSSNKLNLSSLLLSTLINKSCSKFVNLFLLVIPFESIAYESNLAFLSEFFFS